ncbi:hypothetical protein [Azospirillum himalayense]|uniref:Class I SAM-dependent methyltransferase n=1 Tax=Azospirillum himalayense TaxID=654847 RepID=A0ABW0G532_9PROT
MHFPPFAPYARRRSGSALLLDANTLASSTNALRDGGYGPSVFVCAEGTPDGAEIRLSWHPAVEAPGPHEVWALYAAEAPRPVSLRVGGRPALGNALAEPTGGWTQGEAMWRFQGTVDLPAGPIDVTLQRNGWIPTVQSLALFPVDGPATVPGCDARLSDATTDAGTPPTDDDRKELARGLVASLRRLLATGRSPHVLEETMEALVAAVRRDMEHPNRRLGFGGPLNGQEIRQRILRDLDALLQFDAFVETGAYRGTTTEYFSGLGRPVFACELNEEAYYDSLVRLCHLPNVSLFNGDSRAFLMQLLTTDRPRFRLPLFYLDAHWNADLPLDGEIALILERCDDFVIMVDDFKHPLHDYGYDAYEGGAELSLEYLAPRLPASADLVCLMPWMPPRLETGAKRGTLFVVRRSLYDRLLHKVTLLEPIPLAAFRG